MRIGLFHGWRLFGSGSNEYVRYLARALSLAGNEVHVLCREPDPDRLDFVSRAYDWSVTGTSRPLFEKASEEPGECFLHRLPHGSVRPVLVTDKQREGPVKPFISMSDQELAGYREMTTRVVSRVLASHPLDILHANHMVLQPTIAADACRQFEIPFIIYPHGSAIEYTVRRDKRFLRLSGEAITRARGLIIGSREVHKRLLGLYPEQADDIERKSRIVGVGVDTSLFTPVARGSRLDSIRRLITENPGGGKSPGLVGLLHDRLARGELEAVGDYQSAYARTLPDQDVCEHLLRIPWDTGRILLFVGALTVGKGLHRLIAAMPAILERVPDAHLVIVGSGAYREVLEALVYAISRGDRKLLSAMVDKGFDLEETHLSGPWSALDEYLDNGGLEKLLAAGPGFTNHVHLIGRLSHRLLRHLFPCADLAVFPSIIPEAYPLVLMESLSNGVLPAASYHSGFAEGIDALIPVLGETTVSRLRLPSGPDVVAGMADQLGSLLLEEFDESLRAELRKLAVQEYDWSIRARQMLEAYGEFLSPLD